MPTEYTDCSSQTPTYFTSSRGIQATNQQAPQRPIHALMQHVGHKASQLCQRLCTTVQVMIPHHLMCTLARRICWVMILIDTDAMQQQSTMQFQQCLHSQPPVPPSLQNPTLVMSPPLSPHPVMSAALRNTLSHLSPIMVQIQFHLIRTHRHHQSITTMPRHTSLYPTTLPAPPPHLKTP